MQATDTTPWLTTFAPFTAMHIVTVAVLLAAMMGSCWMGRLWRGSERERRFRLAWGWFVALVALATNVYYITPGNWDIRESLPLHLCDLAIIVAAAAMLAHTRWLRILLYFWGIGLSTQAFITPTLQFGVAHPKFWIFWIGHTCIVGSAVYDIVVGGFRPTLRDLGAAILMTVGYLFAMLLVNSGIDRFWPLPDEPANYGYVGRGVPKNPTIINSLGPWPGRLVWLAGIVVADYLLLWGVWPLARRVTGRRDPLAGACPTCGYDTASLCAAGKTVCPECGKPLPPKLA
jgi:hypothetical integral membrane protein (TIGR02206 family)